MSNGLNCKPGDLARVKGTTRHLLERSKEWCVDGTRDALTVVKSVSQEASLFWGVPAWECDLVVCRNCKLEIYAFTDSVLQPIRDPGDDAVDEIIAKVGKAPAVPAKVTHGPWEHYKEGESQQ